MSQPDISLTIDKIIEAHRERMFAMNSRKRMDLALLAYLRLALGWSRKLGKPERDAIASRAKALVEHGERLLANMAVEVDNIEREKDGKAPKKLKALEPQDPAYAEHSTIIEATVRARTPFDKIEADRTKRLDKLARDLPVWNSWAKDVRGLGAVSLATIVAEAGDLSKYPDHSKLWKRLGLAVIDGRRQGGLPKSASKEDWIAHGYSRQRRSFMFVIGDVLVKQGECYREVYLARKEMERAKAEAAGLIVAPAAKIPEKRAAEFVSDGHIHRRAQRYMEKRLLKHLWQAWRRAEKALPEMARSSLPAANEHRDAA